MAIATSSMMNETSEKLLLECGDFREADDLLRNNNFRLDEREFLDERCWCSDSGDNDGFSKTACEAVCKSGVSLVFRAAECWVRTFFDDWCWVRSAHFSRCCWRFSENDWRQCWRRVRQDSNRKRGRGWSLSCCRNRSWIRTFEDRGRWGKWS